MVIKGIEKETAVSEPHRMQQSTPYDSFLGFNNNNVHTVNANVNSATFNTVNNGSAFDVGVTGFIDRPEEYSLDLDMDGDNGQQVAAPMTESTNIPTQHIPAGQGCFLSSANQNLVLSNHTVVNSVPNFTFTTPTQSAMYSPSLMSSNQRYLFQRATPQTFSPTACTPWQHSVPNRIPWMGQTVGMTVSSHGVSIFTAPLCSRSQISWTNMSPHVTTTQDPSPSCSQVPRRPKRSSSENLEYLSPTNKVHLTERMIADHMQELNINSITSPVVRDGLRHDGFTTAQSIHKSRKSSPYIKQNSLPDVASRGLSEEIQWQAFRDLEEKLDVSDEESSDIKKHSCKMKSEPKVVFLENIPKHPSSAVIPQKILDAINKPSLELVLWQPPGDVVKDVISREKEKQKTSTSVSQGLNNSSMLDNKEDDFTMDLDLCEGDDMML